MRRAELAELLTREPWQAEERASFLLLCQLGLQLQERLPPLPEASLARSLTPEARAQAQLTLRS